MARIVADKMSAILRQPIVIENRGRRRWQHRERQVAQPTTDGYTLGLGGTGTLAIDPTSYQKLGYDPRKDFAPVGLIATSALAVLVNPENPGEDDPGADRTRQARSPASSTMRRPASAAVSISAPSSLPPWPVSSSPTPVQGQRAGTDRI